MMTEHWALERLPRSFQEGFWCEQGEFQQTIIRANTDSNVPGFADVLSPKFADSAPPCDLLLG
eukprot:8928230-Lingulodinium_polyedra.AAC.1